MGSEMCIRDRFSPVSPAQAQAAALEAQLVQPTLFSYVANDLVWARASSKATDPFWPVRVVALGSLANGVVESKSIIRSSRDERASLPSPLGDPKETSTYVSLS